MNAKPLAVAIAFLVAGCATPVAKEVPLTPAEARAQETRDLAAAMASAKDANVQTDLRMGT